MKVIHGVPAQIFWKCINHFLYFSAGGSTLGPLSSNEASRAVDALSSSGGGDCPEYAIDGILVG